MEGCEGSSEKTKKQNKMRGAWWKEKWAKRKKVMS